MKLELLSLRAVNCGPLRDVRIDFSDGQGHARPITLLAGANGSGKTTVLELIAALWSLILTVPSPGDEFETTFPDLPRESAFLKKCDYAAIDLLVDERPISVFYGTHPTDVHFSGDYFGWYRRKAFGFRTAVIGRLAFDLRLEFESALTKVNANDSEPPSRSNLPSSILYFPYYRAILKVEGVELARELTEYQPVYRFTPVDAFVGSLEAYLIWLEYAAPDDFLAAQEFFGTLLPSKKSVAIDRRRFKAVVNLATGGQHDLDELSSGEQNLLMMLIDLRRRLTPGSTVLIDEIENSLHPAFQHRLGQALKQMQSHQPFQLIATSHAPEFLDIFGIENTLILTEF